MTEAAPATPQGQGAQPPADTGQGNTPWYRNEAFGLADEEIGYIENKGWKENPKQVLSAYQNLEKFQGVPAEQLIKLPKDMSAEGAMNDIYARLGRPESADKYGEVPLPDELKEHKLDDNRMKWADSIAHKIGLSKAQRNALIAETVGYEAQAMQAYQEQFEQEAQVKLNDLYKRWGAAKEERLELARRAKRSMFGEDATDALDSVMGSAAVVEALAKVGELLKEDKIPGSNDDRPYGTSPEMAKAQIRELKEEIKADPARLGKYNEGSGPDFEKMTRLQKIAYAA